MCGFSESFHRKVRKDLRGTRQSHFKDGAGGRMRWGQPDDRTLADAVFYAQQMEK